MLRLLRRLLLAIVIAALLLGGFAVFLAATSARPRSSEGWRRLPNMPGPRGEVAAAVGTRELDCEEPSGCRNGRALVVAGGIGGIGRASRAVSIFDIEGDRWLRGPDLPEARHHAAAAALGGVVYVTGGARSSTDWTPLKTLWALAPDSDAWTIVPGMFLPEARLGHQMVAVGERLS